MKYGLIESDIQAIKDVFCSVPEIEEVIIFGSRTMGNYKNGSDIDLALKGKKLSFDLLTKVNYHLNEALPLPFEFNVVLYNRIEKKEFLEHIQQHGKVFYNSDFNK